MANLTYRELLQALFALSEDELDQTATVHCLQSDGYFGLVAIDATEEDGVLDAGHIVLHIEA